MSRDKAVHIGPIIREELSRGIPERGLKWCGFTASKPVLLIMGGSLGSQKINQIIRRHAHQLTKTFQIIHICGKGQLDSSVQLPEYKQFEYIHDELADAVACADIVISRAGSNSIFEFLALRKPMLLIPLSKEASRGDQILNARSFEQHGYCEVLLEEEMNDESFMRALRSVYARREEIKESMTRMKTGDAITQVIELILEIAKKQ
jgi:UDP-N-acetylglucosamine--N-acetylmuramyl-(pentapeptide) pyrophosphoryl-undecaprenol N-acetylglucosamine transferase